MLRLCIFFLLLIISVNVSRESLPGQRVKRDTGGAFEGFGGPVAQSSGPPDEDEGGGGGSASELPEIPTTPANIETPTNVSTPQEFDERKCLRFIPESEAQTKFDSFIADFEMKYPTEEERRLRFTNFWDNLHVIQKMTCNAKGDPNLGSFSVNEFADQTYHEFQSNSGGASFDLTARQLEFKEIGDSQSKCRKLDWRQEGVISAPRKQGKCGACYAFSTADLIAAQYQIDRKTSKENFLLAPQYFVDCMKSPAGLGCGGGRPIELLRNMSVCTDVEGCNVPTEDCYPYKGKRENCRIDSCQRSPKITVRWGGLIDASGDGEMEKIASLLQWGPAVVIINAGQSWQFYKNNILRSSQCGKTQNHAVLLVGFDYTGPVPFYIIKNSWGTKWGEGGFIRLEAGKNACGVAKTLTFCCTKNCDKLQKAKDLADHPNFAKC